MKLLLCGDSFSYDHTIEHTWPTRLSKIHTIDNLSQCGCGEYKIKLQLASCDLESYDGVLIFHTSPNRVYYNQLNIMHADNFHQQSDLLFTDVEHHRRTNKLAQIAYDYFVNIFDSDYYSYIHNLICTDIDRTTKQYNVYHFTAFDYTRLYQFNNKLVDLYNVWNHHQGNINHLSQTGHDEFFKKISNTIIS